MAIDNEAYIEYRTLSIRKDKEQAHAVEPIFLREGECGMDIGAYLVDAGSPYYIISDDIDISFCATTAKGEYIKDGNAWAKDDLVLYWVTQELTQKRGKVFVAYFEINDSDHGVLFTTDSIPIIILPAADIGSVATAYESKINQLIDEINAQLVSAETTREEIDQILQSLQDYLGGFELTDDRVHQFPTKGANAEYPILQTIREAGDEGDSDTPDTENDGGITGWVQYSRDITINPATGTITAVAFDGKVLSAVENATNATNATNASRAQVANRLGQDDVGSATKPIYLDGGEPTECGNSLDTDITGTAAYLSRTGIDDSTILLNDDGQLMASATGNVEFDNLPEFTLEWTETGELLMVGGE